MAVRRHVTASMADVDRLRSVFTGLLGESFQAVPVESTGVWNFFVTSVWGVDSSKLFEGLQQLAATGLQCTTEDGSRWYLSLIQPGHEMVQFMHEFHLFRSEQAPDEQVEPPEEEPVDPRLAFLEPDPLPKELQRPWSQFDRVADDYEQMRLPIAMAFRDSVAGLNYGEAINRFRQYESQRMLNALHHAGIRFDQREFLDALLWRSASARERDSDIGNLPRVLLALGIGGSMQAYVRECEQTDDAGGESESDAGGEISGNGNHIGEFDNDDEVDDEENEEFAGDEFDDDSGEVSSEEDAAGIAEAELQMEQMQRDFQRNRNQARSANKAVANTAFPLIDKTVAAAGQVQPVPVDGGPVGLSPPEIPVLHEFASAVLVDADPAAVIRILPPVEFDLSRIAIEKSVPEFLEARPVPGGWQVGIQSLNFAAAPKEGEWQEDHLLQHLGESLTNLLRQPPDGTQIEICMGDPPTPATHMKFVGPVRDGNWQIESCFPAMDRQTLTEALELARDAEKSDYILRDGEEAEAIMAAAESDEFLHNMDVRRIGSRVSCEYDSLGALFRLIFRHRFGHVFDFRPVLAQVEKAYQERQVYQRQARRKAVRKRKQMEAPCDKTRVVYRGSESVYWAADMGAWDRLEPKPLEDFRAGMDNLGFGHVGDFVCRKIRDHVSSYFISPDGLSYGLIFANSFGYAGQEFVSHFEDDAHLTTSTSWMAHSHPEIDAYAQHCPDKSLPELYQQHLWGLGRFRTHKQTLPVRLPATLAGLAALFDHQLAKMKTVESGLISFETLEMEEE